MEPLQEDIIEIVNNTLTENKECSYQKIWSALFEIAERLIFYGEDYVGFVEKYLMQLQRKGKIKIVGHQIFLLDPDLTN